MEGGSIRYQLEADELARAFVTYTPMFVAARRRCRPLGALVLIGGVFLAASLPVVAAVYITYGCIVVLNTLRRYQIRAHRGVIARSPALTEATTVSCDQQGLHVVTRTSDMRFDWAAYEAAVSVPDGLALIQRGGANVRWFPARAFAGEDQQRDWQRAASIGIGVAMSAGSP